MMKVSRGDGEGEEEEEEEEEEEKTIRRYQFTASCKKVVIACLKLSFTYKLELL